MLVAAFSISRRATMFAVRHPANKGCAVFFCFINNYYALSKRWIPNFLCNFVARK